MRRLSVLIVLAGILSASCSRETASPYEKDLKRLDLALEHSGRFVEAKKQRISSIENMIHSRGVTPLHKYHVYGQLYKEYLPFQFDKAKEMLDNQERLADQIGDLSLRNDALLEKAMILTTAGFFLEAERVFEKLDTLSLSPMQMVSWYNSRQKFLHDYQEYMAGSGFVVPDAGYITEYQDRILEMTPATSSINNHIRILRMIESRDYLKAYNENLEFIRTLDKEEHDYAVQTYWQGFICENLDRLEECIYWWVESAICDIRGAITDNASLCSIATKLVSPEDTDRAFHYMRRSLDDALFYNAKLRKVQIASTVPLIEKAYYDSKSRQAAERARYLLLTSLAALLLMLICVYTVSLYIKDRKAAEVIRKKNAQLADYTRSIVDAEDNLRKTNLDLVEANAAKEEYLGLFLSMCSGYLDKLKKTISREQYEAELKNFYKTFDTSFLQLYPTFTEEFNALLKEEGQVVLKEGEMLNTELRIFALIKLGITQSSHIASLLRYSVNTIYNYRAQVKNSVKGDRENFENMVRKIGSRH
ncbi:MAG: hypothetical protein IJB06_01545 [Bacteroidales bacterium]|nr:hypothetical protein [Bacteroidales bacterium]